MGGRGSFMNIDAGDFSFSKNGKNYKMLSYDKNNNIKYLEQMTKSVKLPDYSHTADRIYAIIQDKEIKGIGIYKNHIKVASIDLSHEHTNKVDGKHFNGPHVHEDLYHQKDARELSPDERRIVNIAQKGVNKQHEKK